MAGLASQVHPGAIIATVIGYNKAIKETKDSEGSEHSCWFGGGRAPKVPEHKIGKHHNSIVVSQQCKRHSLPDAQQ